MPNEAQDNREYGKKWLGVLLSLFCPGLGVARAGHVVRGLLWFLAFQVFLVLLTLLIIGRGVPSWAVFCGALAILGCQLAMLVDSFRPGRLRAKRLVILLLVTFLVSMLTVSACRLLGRDFVFPGASMEPTLRGSTNGVADHFYVDRIGYLFSAPKRGDLVVVRVQTSLSTNRAGTLFPRRLVGLPGETIIIREGHVFANGRQLDESDGIPSINYVPPARHLDASATGGVYIVPPGSYFVLGDNSLNSLDSRYYGALPKERIYGRVARIIYPFSRFGVPR